jgi:hypothetical protein
MHACVCRGTEVQKRLQRVHEPTKTTAAQQKLKMSRGFEISNATYSKCSCGRTSVTTAEHPTYDESRLIHESFLAVYQMPWSARAFGAAPAPCSMQSMRSCKCRSHAASHAASANHMLHHMLHHMLQVPLSLPNAQVPLSEHAQALLQGILFVTACQAASGKPVDVAGFMGHACF